MKVRASVKKCAKTANSSEEEAESQLFVKTLNTNKDRVNSI